MPKVTKVPTKTAAKPISKIEVKPIAKKESVKATQTPAKKK